METQAALFERVETALRRLPARRLKEVLLFIEFLEYLSGNGYEEDDSEDDDLWAAVMAHQAYRQAHQEEFPEIFDSPEAFLKATANL